MLECSKDLRNPFQMDQISIFHSSNLYLSGLICLVYFHLSFLGVFLFVLNVGVLFVPIMCTWVGPLCLY